MKRSIQKLFLIFFFFTIAPLSINAQTARLIENKYQKAIRSLEFAKDVLSSYPDRDAQKLLVEAERILRNANLSISSRRNVLANSQIDNANRLIASALRIILNNPIKLQHEKLKELIQYAESIVGESRNRKAEQFLQEAKDHQTKAVQSFINKNYQLALEHFRLANFLVNKAIELAKNHTVKIRDRALEEKQRFEQLLERAKRAVETSDNQTAQKFYNLAKKQIQQTKQLLNSGNYAQAIEHYQRATRLLLRAIDIANVNGENLEIRIFEEAITLDELIENLNNKTESSNQRFMFLMDRIVELQQKVHQALDEKKYQAAQFNIQMARNLIERVMLIRNRRLSDNRTNRIEEEIRQLNNSLDDLETKANESGNKEVLTLIELAREAQQKARTLLNRGNPQVAIGAINIANRFIYTAERMLLEPEENDISINMLAEELENISSLISKLKDEQHEFTAVDNLLLSEAEKMYITAKDAFDKNLYRVADTCVQIARRQLDRIKR